MADTDASESEGAAEEGAGVRPSLDLPTREREALRRILAHDLAPIRRRIAAHALLDPAIVDEAIREYRRYMILARLGDHLGLDEALGMFSPEVDEVWHAHLLHTRDYAAFCDAVFDAFLHHDPQTERASADASMVAQYAFLRAYTRVFVDPPSPLWRIEWSAERIDAFVAQLRLDAAARDAFAAVFPRFAAALMQAAPTSSGARGG